MPVKHTDGKFCLSVNLIFWKRKISFKMTGDNGPSSSVVQAGSRHEGTLEHFQEGTLEARKSTYLESLSETFRKGTDEKPVCDLTGVSSACRQRMSYISLGSKK